jgi:hypothetical protein
MSIGPCRRGSIGLSIGFTEALRIVAARLQQAFANVDDLARRAQLDQADQADLRHLAAADALQSLAGHRRQQVWEATVRHKAPPLLREAPVHEQALLLPAAPEADEINIDYAATGLTLRRHPLALLRKALTQRKLHSAAALQTLDNGKPARVCGLVTMRQQPQTAKGTLFVSIEDETGSVNVVVWRSVRDNCCSALLQAQLLAVHGTWQNVDGASPGGSHVAAARPAHPQPGLSLRLTQRHITSFQRAAELLGERRDEGRRATERERYRAPGTARRGFGDHLQVMVPVTPLVQRAMAVWKAPPGPAQHQLHLGIHRIGLARVRRCNDLDRADAIGVLAQINGEVVQFGHGEIEKPRNESVAQVLQTGSRAQGGKPVRSESIDSGGDPHCAHL